MSNLPANNTSNPESKNQKDILEPRSAKQAYSFGADFSTQSVKIVILDIHNKEIIYTSKIEFDRIFPEYRTTGGILDSPNPDVKHTSPFMLIEVFEYMFQKIKNDGINVSNIHAIKIAGMQHCTVYTNASFKEKIRNLSPELDIIDQIRPCISRKTSPLWEDRSPVEETKILTEMMKSNGGIDQITGNKAELRFPASQILKWAKQSPEEYKNTGNIFLLSSFLTSLLTGMIAPVDTGDGWGTNLNSKNLIFPGWSNEILSGFNAYLSGLGLNQPIQKKIGAISHYDKKLGLISPYFVKKYGINNRAIILAGTGDNPAALLGCGGDIVISLGSRYTASGVIKKIIPSGNNEYNLFGYTKRKAMALTCITNGAKLHEHFLKTYLPGAGGNEITNNDSQEYTKIAGSTILTEDEKLMLPYLLNESVPLHKAGIIRDGFDDKDAQANIRSLHISQCLSLKLHTGHLSKNKKICIAGGGSKNPVLRQMLTDIFGVSTYSIKNPDFEAAIGCAISGAKALLRITYGMAARRFAQKNDSTLLSPIKKNLAPVKHLLNRYADLEKKNS